MHAHQFLTPEGRLVAVMSAGVEFRQNRLTCELRELVAHHGGRIEPLPEGSLRPPAPQ